MSEKLDGIFGYWDGKGTLFLANGNPVSIPEEMKRELPLHVSLVGELWCGRGQYERCKSLVCQEGAWEGIRLHVFDSIDDFSLPFEQRMNKLRSQLADSSHIKVVESWRCVGNDQLKGITSSSVSIEQLQWKKLFPSVVKG